MDGYEGWGVRGEGGGRSVSVCDGKPKQVSTSQTDRQNTLTLAAQLMSITIRYSIAEDKEYVCTTWGGVSSGILSLVTAETKIISYKTLSFNKRSRAATMIIFISICQVFL